MVMAAAISISLNHYHYPQALTVSSISNPKELPYKNSSFFIPKPQKGSHHVINNSGRRPGRIPATYSAGEILLVSESATSSSPPENPDQLTAVISGSDEGVTSYIISALLLIAFVGLSLLTIGVIYIGVTDFLQKREKERFEKEEAAANAKKGGKRRRVRARAGPKGFGQRSIQDEDEDI